MNASPQTVDYPIQRDDASGGNPFSPAVVWHTPLPSGTAGTFATLEAMASCVCGEVPPDFCGYECLTVKRLADQLVTIEGCFDYVAHRIKYVAHPIDQQVVQDACRTIQFKTGDCVSKSVLLATLLASMDYDVRFVAQYWDDVQAYSHVYVEALDKQSHQWLPLDPVANDKPMGWTQSLPDGGFETPYDIF